MTAYSRLLLCWIGSTFVLLAMHALPETAAADSPTVSTGHQVDDAAAREEFLLGRAAYEEADYERALAHFREAYRLSKRAKLHYNIGISAQRLGMSHEALEAFEAYLDKTAQPAREQEVRERIALLRAAIEQSSAANDVALDADTAVKDERSFRRIPRSAIIGGSVLGAIGVTGIAAMAVGVAQNGTCLETDISGACVTQRTASPWTAVYGSLGFAALAGSAAWFAVSSRRAKRERQTTWRLSPTGVTVSGSF